MNSNSGFTTSGGQSADHPRENGAFPPGDAVVRFDAVGMRYAQAPEVFSNLTFALPRGSFHFLTGASGAGKTSLLSLIYLAHRPSSGGVSLFGRAVASLGREELAPIRRRIGVVVDLSAMLYLWRTASPNSSSRALFLSGLSTRVGGVELARVREAQALSLL